MKAFPVLDETILENTFRVACLFSEALIEIEFVLFACFFVGLDILHRFQLTVGAMMSGRSLPEKPILVLRDPTYMINGMPYWCVYPSGIYINSREYYFDLTL